MNVEEWQTLLSLPGAAVGSAIGAVIGIWINSKLINYRLEQIEKKLDHQNKTLERTTERLHELESRCAVTEAELERGERGR